MNLKNGFKRTLACLLVALLLLTSVPLAGMDFSLTASAATEGYFAYSNNAGDVEITGCDTSISGELVIPDTLDGCPVTSIGSSAFEGCTGLTSITIPDSVTSIGEYAFEDCTGLTSITIPDSVISIGEYAFRDCTGLTSITVSSGNKVYHSENNCIINTEEKELVLGCKNSVIPSDGSVTSVGYRAFEGCAGLTSITIPDSVTSISSWAFYGCTGLTSVTIGNSVTSIGDGAFCGCTGLTSVTIPNSVTSIGDGAFWGCTGLTSITVSSGNKVYHSENNCIINTGVKELVLGCKNSVIPSDGSVTSIGDSAFSGCTGLTSITIPDSVKSIGSGAFWNCTGLTSVTIPDSVTSIGDSAFEDCTGLTSITIPDSVTSIGGSVFSGCTGLTSITIPDSVTSIGDSAFNGTDWYNSQPDGDVYAGKVYYEYKGEMPENTSIEIKAGTKGIADFAFSWRTGLTSITIPDSVTSIGEHAFVNCIELADIEISKNVEDIRYAAFADCINLKVVKLPKSIKTIGEYAFGYYYDEENDAIAKVSDFVIHGYAGTAAETYANKNGFTFVALDDEHTHTFSAWTVTTEATCTSEGVETRTCSGCGATETRKTEKIDHSFFHVEEDSTCKVQGVSYDICDMCNETFNYTVLPLAPHTFGDWATTKEAKCEVVGEESRSCSVCGTTETREIAALEHDYKHITTASTCTKHGFEKYVCNKCGNEINYNELPLVPHTFGVWTVTREATCTAEGEETRTCSVCGAIETRKTEKKEHSLTHVEEDSTCKIQGVSYDICDMCNETFNYTVLPLAPHTFGDWTTTKEAKCEAAGEESRSCSVCGATETRDVAALEHDYKHITVASTCAKHGYEKDVCNKCGNEINYKELPLVPHTFGGWAVTKEATVFENGEKVRTCSVCNFSETEEIEKIKSEEVKDEKTNVSVICPDGSYEGTVEIQVTETFDGESYHVLDTEKGNYKKSLFDITTLVDGKKVQPNGSVFVKIPLPEGYNAEKTSVYYVTNDGKLEKVSSRIEDGYIIFETNHFSFYAIVDEGSNVNPSANCPCACHKKGIVKFFFKIKLFFQKIFKKNRICKCGIRHY